MSGIRHLPAEKRDRRLQVGSHEEFDDPQLGIGHGRPPLGSNGSRSPVLGVVYVLIHRIPSFRSPPARSAARNSRTATAGLTCPCVPRRECGSAAPPARRPPPVG